MARVYPLREMDAMRDWRKSFPSARESHYHWSQLAHRRLEMTVPLSRRRFLQAAAGATLAAGAAPARVPIPGGRAKNCILLLLTGGPGQLDTWDPKPDAPSDVRGPFSPIRTVVPGMHVSELFPKMAAMTDKFSLIRTMHHEYAPIHENGFQLLNTGRRFGDGVVWPSVGNVLSFLRGSTTDRGNTRHYVSPNTNVETGLDIAKGFAPGFLADRVEFQAEGTGRNFSNESPADWLRTFHSDARDERYTMTGFGQNCLQAMRSVTKDRGRFVTVNMFSTVFDSASWDCHASPGSLRCSLSDYAETVAPTFDAAFSSLIHDLDVSGRLDDTLVVAVGEFGRTPKLNCHGGRDHWSNCWTAIVAGGGMQGGRIIGESDAIAGEPKDRPVHCSELVATIFHAMGIPPATTIPGPDGSPVRVVEAEPVWELF
jgi:hypothetical protein